MKRIWNNIKTFFGNLKKLYRLAQRVSFYDNTIIFNSSVEATNEVRAGMAVKMYCVTEQKLQRVYNHEENEKKDVKQLEKSA